MDKKQTLETLETFIQAQRALFTRTQEDISRLNEIKARATHSVFQPDELGIELSSAAPALDSQSGIASEIQQDINWSLFKGLDPVGLRRLQIDANEAHAARVRPPTTQLTPLSPLQQFVKECRKTILEPVFSALPPPSEDEASEDEVNLEQLRRERARTQIRALRGRRIGEGGLTLLPGSVGVYVRRDTADESADVDMDVDNEAVATPRPQPLPCTTSEINTINKSPPPRPSRRQLRAAQKVPPPKPTAKRKHAPAPPSTNVVEQGVPSQQPRRSSKQSETYKQSWSMSEQHLLERLLQEIPDGEKNRWAKISRAMQGRRTPRQVASRVQKYFEKLKRFGVDIANGGGSSAATLDDMDDDPS